MGLRQGRADAQGTEASVAGAQHIMESLLARTRLRGKADQDSRSCAGYSEDWEVWKESPRGSESRAAAEWHAFL